MSAVIFDQVNRLGVRSTVTLDPDHKAPIIGTMQDCAPIIEQNRREANAWQRAHQNNPIRARKIASIPFVVLAQMQQIGIIDRHFRVIDEPAFLALLSDPDLRGLRCDNGGRLV